MLQVEAKIDYVNNVEELSDVALERERVHIEKEIATLNDALLTAHEKLRIIKSAKTGRDQLCQECYTTWNEKPEKHHGANYKTISCPNCYRDYPIGV